MSELTSSLSSEGKMSAIMFRASSIKILSRLGSGLSVGDLKYQNLKRVLNSFNYLKNKTLVFHNKATRNKVYVTRWQDGSPVMFFNIYLVANNKIPDNSIRQNKHIFGILRVLEIA